MVVDILNRIFNFPLSAYSERRKREGTIEINTLQSYGQRLQVAITAQIGGPTVVIRKRGIFRDNTQMLER